MSNSHTIWLTAYAEGWPEGDSMEGLTAFKVPLHPDPHLRSLIALRVPVASLGALGVRVPQPSSLIDIGENFFEMVWLIRDPISTPESRTENLKPYNAWRHVTCALSRILKAEVLEGTMYNPYAVYEDEMLRERVAFPGAADDTLWDIKGFWMQSDDASLRKLYLRSTWDPKVMSVLGGKAKSPAQRKARQENVQRATEAASVAAKARGQETARRVMRLVEEGLTTEQMSQALKIAPDSVGRTVTRARATLGLRHDQVSERQKAEEEERDTRLVGVEELVELLSSST